MTTVFFWILTFFTYSRAGEAGSFCASSGWAEEH